VAPAACELRSPVTAFGREKNLFRLFVYPGLRPGLSYAAPAGLESAAGGATSLPHNGGRGSSQRPPFRDR
jgi:hypothetical protein